MILIIELLSRSAIELIPDSKESLDGDLQFQTALKIASNEKVYKGIFQIK